jgi:E3 ubiquitin-protein ligase synoviolin
VALLRVMEAEMARLRAQYAPNHQFGVAASSSQNQSPFATTQQVLHGANAQSISNGHENLPQGLVLPEGWTLMPLHRQEGATTSTVPVATPATGSRHNAPEPSGEQSTALQGQSSDALGTTAEVTQQSSTSPAPLAVDSTTGPTDERGSPLFVATAPVAGAPASSLQSENQAPTQPQPQPQHTNSDATVSQPTPERVPWSSSSWGFDDQTTEDSAKATETSASATSPEQQPEAEAQGSNEEAYAGKGKGRAVEVEDAPDQDA